MFRFVAGRLNIAHVFLGGQQAVPQLSTLYLLNPLTVQQQRAMSSANAPLQGKVALVTGASRGLGKGIAIELGASGATVYITGRSASQSDAKNLKEQKSSLEEVADEITKRGGKARIIYCDHSKPDDIQKLFERINGEQDGKLDLLVNNAFSAVYYMLQHMGKKFYDVPDSPENSYDAVNNVGLRNNYICAVYAARMMTKKQSGLIVNVSSIGAINYLFNIPYGFCKAALVRMSADMAIELADKNVQSISLLPGGVQTEIVSETVLKGPSNATTAYFSDGESIYYPGRVISFLTQRPDLLKKYNGKAVTTTEIGDQYGVLDVDGRLHRDKRIDNYKNFLPMLNKNYTEPLPQ